ncbi:uncharacterized protein BO97DRAFT_380184 [Aspergillus homomorphus CBS 101889]|uniref:Thioredoxin domain-containing protein n=1 Tax=Aspergillus homomorphus (strain CBS 101889) TaxID=1450537 RepID=A0A395HFB3_ASPHC|nr:hypothetical protein BO97DRAFT_380175 [Aspergillus homomorphus CBS 101889]XP_025545708.1 hypothetical protein BO97DRAFT_380184 [Aspergillus homomorphus CBS 101889]RAL06547.1 hypothetical protein BO97DRAFT_380175 [Aspergillus homomorphus CBS 101889]RAL06554.1 hypothetical protein BO97DRAFT_380184 [Aspergillus homomorphus CBS 101889]
MQLMRINSLSHYQNLRNDCVFLIVLFHEGSEQDHLLRSAVDFLQSDTELELPDIYTVDINEHKELCKTQGVDTTMLLLLKDDCELDRFLNPNIQIVEYLVSRVLNDVVKF